MKDKLRDVLINIQNQQINVDEGLQEIEKMYYYDLGYAVLDTHRQFRKGFPEVIFCSGKTTDQIIAIAKKLAELSTQNILATRANLEIYQALQKEIPAAEFNETARTIVIRKGQQQSTGNIVVVSAGTSDLPVAEEAAATAEIMGNKVERMYDTGVAGLHRLLVQSERLLQANAVIVVAGMDGALPSVVAGLISKPVIAVPTSVGYGANFGGLSALLAMLNSCSAGIGVVNIDNGFGAGYLASLINQPGH
ncbi:MAG: N5-carboxyaminoimidazole ribonucleotide mutase [Candidatus Dichloromethanomonas elyunquensis]|nr:MAG: N5-carboxyaminoimidazole ribonucleotide mutase [Candidatus Dichloromethanomonas elyunquensis]